MLFSAFSAYSIYTPVLTLYTPDHWCTPDPEVTRRMGKDGGGGQVPPVRPHQPEGDRTWWLVQ